MSNGSSPLGADLDDPASPSAVAALQDDPFYRTISIEFADETPRRRRVLEKYFSYSIHEGFEAGRTNRLPDPAVGVSVWLFPELSRQQAQLARDRKKQFLSATLGSVGAQNYHRIVNYMSVKAAEIVPEGAWYLSIIAVNPAAQGQGLGQKLLAPTLEEADRSDRVCYLETFTPRSVRFYERLGFTTMAQIAEPTTGHDYVVMVRRPLPVGAVQTGSTGQYCRAPGDR